MNTNRNFANIMIPEQITPLSELSSHIPISTSVLPSTTHTTELVSDKTTELLKLIQTAPNGQNILKLNWMNFQSSNEFQEYTEHKNKVDEYASNNQGDFVNIQSGFSVGLKNLINQLQPCHQIGMESHNCTTDNSEIISTSEANKSVTMIHDSSEVSTWNPSKLYRLCNEIKQHQEYPDVDSKLSTDLILLLNMLNDSASPIVASVKLGSKNSINNDNNNQSNYEGYNMMKTNNFANIECFNKNDLLNTTNIGRSEMQSTNKISNNNNELLFTELQEKLTSGLFKSNDSINTLGIQHEIRQQQPQSKLYDTSDKKPVLHWAKLGVPQPASPTRYSAPVHIDVGGTLYTSSLKVLTKYPNSILGKMFNGTIPIVLDTMKQHYFIDRDGVLFRHVLNFLRTNKVNLDPNFTEFDQLVEEATFYGLDEMVNQLKKIKTEMKRKEINNRKYVHDEKKNETEMPYPPKKQSKIDTTQKSEINDICPNSVVNSTIKISNLEKCIANSSPSHQKDQFGNRLSPNKVTQSQCFFLLIEIDKISPHQGRMIFSKCNNLRFLECFNDLNNYFANHLPNSYQITEYDSHSEITWFVMSTYNQLKLWELLLNHNCELTIQYQIKKADRNCNICLFRSK
ncbi:putative potassium channel tetramerization domain-containing [Schistosoma mansoni]|nr:putative potassium channel tetramerization domain-containing [Schistosoma mansoni]|eukprot:XP_018651899.1 putative potassium channel tetramerization domain-containing [Schistosoma mansoni]